MAVTVYGTKNEQYSHQSHHPTHQSPVDPPVLPASGRAGSATHVSRVPLLIFPASLRCSSVACMFWLLSEFRSID